MKILPNASVILGVSLFILLFLGGCSQAPKRSDPKPSGSADRMEPWGYRAQVQLHDKVEGQIYTLVLESVIGGPALMKSSLQGPFATPMGQILIDGPKVFVLDIRNKKYFYGQTSENVFRVLVPLTIEPFALISMMSGQRPKGWDCKTDHEDKVTCLDPSRRLTWRAAQAPKTLEQKWSVSSEQFALTVFPQKIETKVEVNSKTFFVPIPAGYSKHKLP